MRRKNVVTRLIPAAIISILLITFMVRLISAQTTGDAQDVLDAAQRKISQLGAYRFTTHLVEIREPAGVSQVDLTPTERHLHLEGSTDRDTGAFNMLIWDSAQATYDPEQALEVKAEDRTLFGRYRGQEWEQLQEMEGLQTASETLIYLDAAHHVSRIADNELEGGQHLQFVIDGDRLSWAMREQLQDYLQASGQLPAGLTLAQSNYYANTVATGELWLDADGLPRRLFVNIEWPARNGERVTALIQTDFGGYNVDRLIPAFVANPAAWLTGTMGLTFHSIDWLQTGRQISLLGVVLMVVFAVICLRRYRLVYKLFAAGMVMWMALSPLSTAIQAHSVDTQLERFTARQVLYAQDDPPPGFAPTEDGDVSAELLRMQRRDYGHELQPVSQFEKPLNVPFDTTRSPMESGHAADQVRQAVEYLHDPSSAALGAASTSAITGTDSDEDGLDDAMEEGIWGTSSTDPDSDDDGLSDGQEVAMCPDVNGGWNQTNRSDSVCANPTLPDTDGDGLSDGEEHLYIGTDANAADTDGDLIPDAIEVGGFMVGAERRYTDPLNPDTDADSLPDGAECPQLTEETIVATCQNSDNDNVPDVFDDDNDGDGIFNRLDNAPYTKIGNFDDASPFQLNVGNLQANRTVLVDMTVNTLEPDHMGYPDYTLDWPSGDTEGQIQRRLDTTFPGTNGDLRAVPMLEMTFAPGTAPLPRRAAQVILPLTTFEIMGTVRLIDNEDEGRIDVYVPSLDAINGGAFSLGLYNMTCTAYETTSNPAAVTSFSTVNANSSYEIPGKRLADYADGGHVMVLTDTTAGIAECTPIEKLAENGTQLALLFLRDRERLGNVHFNQSDANIGLSFDWEPASSQTDHTIEVLSGSCDVRGEVVVPARVISKDEAYTEFAGMDLTGIADGQHILTVDRGGREALCATIPNIINGAPNETTMVDLYRLQEYNITVNEEDATGTLVASFPLTQLTDQRSGRLSGFAGQMMFDTAGGTSIAAETRMVWWVQVLTDNCLEPPVDFMADSSYEDRLRAYCGEGVDRMQLVHKYDDAWMLGGLTVREEQGLRVAVIYENPDTDAAPDSDDYLWKLSKDLDQAFVEGEDCSSGGAITQPNCAAADGHVTLTGDGIDARTASWGYPANTFAIERHDYASTSGFGQIPQYVLPNILQTRFMDREEAIAAAPLIMFAREEKFRIVDLETPSYANHSGNALTVDFSAGGEALEPVTSHAINWRPYRFKDGKWQAYDPGDYLDFLEVRLRDASGFTAGDDEASRDEAAGKLYLARVYFAYMMRGRSQSVYANFPTHKWDDSAPDTLTDSARAQQLAAALEEDNELDDGELLGAVLNPVGGQLSDNYHKFNRSLFSLDREALTTNIKLPPKQMFRLLGGTVRRQSRSGFNNLSNYLARNSARKVGARAAAGVIVVGAIAVDITSSSGAVSEDDMFAAERIFEGIEVASAVKEAADALRDISKAEQAAFSGGTIGAAAAARNIGTAASEVGKSAKYGGVVAAVVGETIAWGALIYTIAAADLEVGGLAANQMAADAAGGSAIAIAFAVIAATGPIGLAIAAVIGAIDAIIQFACAFLDKAQQESTAGEIICTGISGWLAKGVAFVVYAANDMVTIDDPYRLNTTNLDTDLLDTAAGFVPNAQVNVAVSVQNTIDLIGTPPNLGATYWWQYDLDALKSSAFAYALATAPETAEENKLHSTSSLERESMTADWMAFDPGNEDNTRHFIEKSASEQFAIDSNAGPNRPVPAYLAEAYAIPVQECFVVPVPPGGIPTVPVCYVRSRADTNYTNLNLTIDIFPATLEGFFELARDTSGSGQVHPAWGQAGDLKLPNLQDADGDGLRFDADVNDASWDDDQDRIPDGVEIVLKSDPGSDDHDGDNLKDPYELMIGTNPLVGDTDHDGINDGDEVAGWVVGYGVADSAESVISSDPLQPDADKDGILDGQEAIYGFNPRVANDRNVFNYETDFNEPGAPLAHLPFEEPSQSTTFVDTSGAAEQQVATCITEDAGTHLVIERMRSLNGGTTGFILIFGDFYDNIDVLPGETAEIGAVSRVDSEVAKVTVEFVAFSPTSFTVDPATTPRNQTFTQYIAHSPEGYRYEAEIDYRLVEHDYDCPQAGGPGAFGNSLFFDGVNDLLRVADNSAINQLDTHFTVGAWIYPLTTAGRQTIMATDRRLATHGFELSLNGDALQFGFLNGQTFQSAAGVIQANHWQQVMVEVWDPNPADGAYTVYFIVNGSGVGTAAGSQIGAPAPDADLLIGADIDRYSALVDAFAGYLDDVVIYGFTAVDNTNVLHGYNGAHNANDLIVRPGQRLLIDNTIQNQTLKRSITGIHSVDFPALLTDASDQREDFELAPATALRTSDLIEISNGESGIHAVAQSVEAQVADRADRVWSPPGTALAYHWNRTRSFDNVSTLKSDNPALAFSNATNPNPGFTLSVWIKPTYDAGDTKVRGVFGRNSGQVSATPYLQTQGKDILFGFGTGSVHRQAAIKDKLVLNRWNFVAIKYAYNSSSISYYIDDQKTGSPPLKGTTDLTDSGDPQDMGAGDSFLIGRSSNEATVVIDRVKVICEGDGFGEGEYDIVRTDSNSNVFKEEGSDDAEWKNLNTGVKFTDEVTLRVCEDDDGNHNTCEGGDDRLVSLIFSTNGPPIDPDPITVSNPSGRTVCEMEAWYNWSWPDILEIDYSMANESVPFKGEIKDIRVNLDVLDDTEIAGQLANNRTIVQFNLDDPPRSTTFEDFISYHQGTCDLSLGQCPLSGVEGRENRAVDFDGIDDGIDADTVSAAAASNTPLTMAAWFKADKNDFATVLAFQDASNNIKNEIILLPVSGSSTQFRINYHDPTNSGHSAAGTYEIGKWHRVVVTIDQNNNGAIYVDSVGSKTTFTTGSRPTADGHFRIGYRVMNNARGDFLDGSIDNVLVEKIAWSDNDTIIDRRQVPTYLNHFEDALPVGSTTPLAGLEGQVGKAMEFDGVDDVIDLGTLATVAGDHSMLDFTIGVWVKGENFLVRDGDQFLTLWRTIMGGYDTSDNSRPDDYFNFSIESSGKPEMRISGDVETADYAVLPNVWTHISVTYSSLPGTNRNLLTFYINGGEAGSQEIPVHNVLEPKDFRLMIGGQFNAHPVQDTFDGRMDELVFYRRGLSEREILDLYNIQNAWVGEEDMTEVTRASQPPAVSLELDRLYLPLVPSQVLITTDANFAQTIHANLIVNSTSRYPAPTAAGNEFGNAFVATFSPLDEGMYTLQATATDAVGNQAAYTPAKTVYVDGRSPFPGIDAFPTPMAPTLHLTDGGKYLLSFSGSIDDPPIAGTAQSGSGVAAVNIYLVDVGSQTIVNNVQAATLVGNRWSIDYEVISDDPSGEYELFLQAIDNVGNEWTYPLLYTVKVDAAAPGVRIDGLGELLTQAGDDPDALPGFFNGNSVISGTVDETPPGSIPHEVFAGVSAVQTRFEPLIEDGSPFVNRSLSPEARLYLPLDEIDTTEATTNDTFVDLASGLVATCDREGCPLSGAAGKIGNALAFDGVDDRLLVTHTPGLNDLTNNFTAAAWIKPYSADNWGRIVSTSRLNSNNGWGFGMRDSSLIFTTYGILDYKLPFSFEDNRWYHIAAVMDNNNDVVFYVNGIVVGSVPGSVPANADADDGLEIGSLDNREQFFHGLIDDVAVVATALPAAEVRSLMGLAPTTHIRFDATQFSDGQQLVDASGLGSDAFVDLETVRKSGNRSNPGVVGPYGMITAGDNGSQVDVITVNAATGALPAGDEPYSIALWGNFDSPTTESYLSLGDNSFNFSARYMGVDWVSWGFQEASFNLVPGTWHHFVWTYDGDQRVLYVDGLEVIRDDPTVANSLAASGETKLSLYGWDGAVDDLRVYRRALLPLEIAALAQTGWRTANLVTDSAVEAGTWSASPPDGLEGFYALRTRAFDGLSNHDADVVTEDTWRGIVDSLTPRTRYTVVDSGAAWTYIFEATDFNLKPDTLLLPDACIDHTSVTTSQFASSWYLSLARQAPEYEVQLTQREYSLTATCTLDEPLDAGAFSICDVTSNCVAVTWDGAPPIVVELGQKLFLPAMLR